jgi:hypothetical protein
MAYGLLLGRLARECPAAWVLIEHLPDELVGRAREAVVGVKF